MTAPSINPVSLTFTLLRLLSDGEFHSGELLAQQLQISRASVNNALRFVDSYGLTLYRIRGRGYRLANPPKWLDTTQINRYLGKQRRVFQIAVADCVDSTNTQLLRKAAIGAPSGSVLAVEWQSSGRGRMGRHWHSGLGNALTFSLLWRFERGLSALSGLSLAAGVALIRGLASLGLCNLQLKWPNDILDTKGAKLGGLLIEAQGDMLGPATVVIGVGLNLSLPPQISHRIDQPASSLSETCVTVPDRNLLLAVLLLKLHDVLKEFSDHGLAPFRDEWESSHAYQNRSVSIQLSGSQLIGIVRGISNDGALKLETASGMQFINSGDISLVDDKSHAVA